MAREPVGLLHDAPIRIVDEIVIAGRDDRYRYAPSLVQLPDGDLLVTYTEAIGEYPSDNGWVVLRRSGDGGRSWSAPQTLYADPGWACLGTAGLRLFANGELICVVREDEKPDYRICQLFSSDDGATWTAPEPTGFTGSSFCLVQLRDSILCIHRDMRPGELGVTVHYTRDEGRSWRSAGRLHA